MGVLGFTPFIQKTCPEVIKHFPDRLKAFAGKRIVFDGTLITQRLHFAPVPHPYRHIIGWYRLVKELENFGVQAICVFDGKERSTAKAREVIRRRHAQKLAAARSAIEEERLKRLNLLHTVIGQLPRLSPFDRAQLSKTLQREITAKDRTIPPLPDFSDSFWSQHVSSVSFPTTDFVDISDHGDYVLDYGYDRMVHRPLYYEAERTIEEEYAFHQESGIPEPFTYTNTNTTTSNNSSAHEIDSEDIDFELVSIAPQEDISNDNLKPNSSYKKVEDDISSSQEATSLSSEQKETTTETSQASTSDNGSPAIDREPDRDAHTLPIASETSTPETEPSPRKEGPEEDTSSTSSLSLVNRLASALSSLYLQYRESISKITSIPFSSQHSVSVSDDGEQEAVKSEYEMSRKQYKLALEEGEVWDWITGGRDEGGIRKWGDSSKPAHDTGLASETVSNDDDGDQITGAADIGSEFSQTSVAPEISQETLLSLTQKSSMMSESYKRSAHPPTTQTYNECRELLSAMGVPCVEATGTYEAEAVASSLVLNGHADYVASEDTDVLIYEAPLIRNITNRNAPLIVVSGAEVRDVLQLTRPMYIDFALLLGTDFSQRIKNVGPARALKFIREHGSIEKVIEAERKYVPKIPLREYLIQVDAGREVFGTLPPITKEIARETRKMGQWDRDECDNDMGDGDGDGSENESWMVQKKEKDEANTRIVTEKYGLSWALETCSHEEVLDGNYFGDDPSSGPSW
ncbi:PIN domain-like protein [Dendrothele bispora CBS 962.96]|uniref:PIN domain-like protein n=1 Tax=Dendrothele bispora (strain CBS 962.96) TaxID=1314807 RepID=A0A4S8KVY5_DENBC|nr:PIN domain-like protein [Dendrothele bispora CBS 962.96]